MTWKDVMLGKIQIDHILPVSSFDLAKPEEQKICFHFTNLQPLWDWENLMKRDKTPEEWEVCKASGEYISRLKKHIEEIKKEAAEFLPQPLSDTSCYPTTKKQQESL